MGALGAFAWCFPDSDRSLWDRPPCDFQWHERFFGLVRADGTIKPMGRAVQQFAKSKPTIQAPEKTVTLPVSPDEFYKNPQLYLKGMYEAFGTM